MKPKKIKSLSLSLSLSIHSPSLVQNKWTVSKFWGKN